MNLPPVSWCISCCCLRDARERACEYYGSGNCNCFHGAHHASGAFRKAIIKTRNESGREAAGPCLTELLQLSSPGEFPKPSSATADEVRFCRTVELSNLRLRCCCVRRPTRDNQSPALFAPRVPLPGSSRPVGEKIRRATECAHRHGK